MRSPLWHIFVAFFPSCKYGLIWLVFISLTCCMRRKYQNPHHNHWPPLPTPLLSIQHPDYSPDVACRPTVLFPKYLVCTKEGPTVNASTSKGLRRSQGLSLEIVMMKTNSTDEEREPRGKCWLRLGSSTLGCRSRQKQWLARVVLYEAFSPKSTITFVPLPSFLLHFYRLTLAHLFWLSYILMLYVNHYPRKQDNARRHTYPTFSL